MAPHRNGVRSAKPRVVQLCPEGRTLLKSRKARPEHLSPGPCAGCGVEVHAPFGACSCSFVRTGRLVCRQCAFGFDYVTKGWTKIEGAPFTPEEVVLGMDLLRRGTTVAQLSTTATPALA